MRMFLVAIIALASAGISSAQAPTSIRDVAKLVEMRTDGGATYPVFEYEGVSVSGDVLLRDYNDAIGIVRQKLRRGEQIIAVIASQQIPLQRQHGKDLMVETCMPACNEKRSDGGHSGRYFVFERVASKLQLSVVSDWIE